MQVDALSAVDQHSSNSVPTPWNESRNLNQYQLTFMSAAASVCAIMIKISLL